jgi:hypothetical protein
MKAEKRKEESEARRKRRREAVKHEGEEGERKQNPCFFMPSLHLANRVLGRFSFGFQFSSL